MVLSGAYITIAGRQALLTSPVYSEELWVYREDMKILKKKKIQNRFLLKKVALESWFTRFMFQIIFAKGEYFTNTS